jgi:hypothetical protein
VQLASEFLCFERARLQPPKEYKKYSVPHPFAFFLAKGWETMTLGKLPFTRSHPWQDSGKVLRNPYCFLRHFPVK